MNLIEKIDAEIEHHKACENSKTFSIKTFHKGAVQGLSLAKQFILSEQKEPCDRDYWKAEAIKATAELGEMKIAEASGLIFDVTRQMDLDGTKRIIQTLLENQIGVPMTKETISYWVDDILR